MAKQQAYLKHLALKAKQRRSEYKRQSAIARKKVGKMEQNTWDKYTVVCAEYQTTKCYGI